MLSKGTRVILVPLSDSKDVIDKDLLHKHGIGNKKKKSMEYSS